MVEHRRKNLLKKFSVSGPATGHLNNLLQYVFTLSSGINNPSKGIGLPVASMRLAHGHRTGKLSTMPSEPETETVRCIYGSPLGDLHLTATARGISGLAFRDAAAAAPVGSLATASTRATHVTARQFLASATTQLDDYFAGKLKPFDFPLDLTGTTFQRQVWEKLQRTSAGSTVSYATLASQILRPRAARAVGSACARNPLPVIIPCHRVVCTGDGHGGYLGGPARKAWLLRHEANQALYPSAASITG